jgi:hypothetical protein
MTLAHSRIQVEIHPDSRLRESLAYRVPVDKPQRHSLKLVQDIRFLDPCCGSMHFGLVAFDLFVEMYREELERAEQLGWPERPSVSSADEIPASIIANNLHGIDLDLRAVQIAALALLLKARTIQPKAQVTDLNLACANVEEISGGRLDAFISQAKFSHPIYERILRALAARLKQSAQLGSLLRLEKTLEQLIDEERRKAETDKQFILAFPGLSAEQFKTREGIAEFFGLLTEQVLRHLDNFVQASRAAGSEPGRLVNEASKGLRYLRLVSRQYDVVATNPPYMSRRNMSEVMAKHLDEQYPQAKSDLYAAFIARCVELAEPLGKVAMITQQSFMFISSYEDLRKELRSTIAIETMAHLGPKAFANITGEKVNTTAFVFEKQPDEQRREQQLGVYFRLVKEPDAESKRRVFEGALAALRNGQSHLLVFRYRQRDFDAIPGGPWVYWLSKRFRDLFRDFPKIGDIATTAVGQNTGNNFRFLRFWWEVGATRVFRGCKSQAEGVGSGKRWFPYMKGGTPVPWWGNQSVCLNWHRDGAEVKAYAVIRNNGRHWSRYLQNLDYLFKLGITWSDVSSGGFAVRLSPGGFIHDVTGMGCYPKDEKSLPVLLGILNTRVARFLLSAINPTIHFQAGDVRRLPCPNNAPPALVMRVEEALTGAIHNPKRRTIV